MTGYCLFKISEHIATTFLFLNQICLQSSLLPISKYLAQLPNALRHTLSLYSVVLGRQYTVKSQYLTTWVVLASIRSQLAC